MTRPAPRPRKYEMMIVVAPTVTEEGLPAVIERVSGLIEAQDGEIESFTHDSPWGHRRLAYPIQNFRDAFYVLYYFHVPPRAIGELDRELRLDSTIIRHLIVKFDPLAYRAFDTDGEGAEDSEDESATSEPDGAVAEAAPSEPEAEEAADTSDDAEDSNDEDEADTEVQDDDSEIDESEAEDSNDGEEAEADVEDNDADDGEEDKQE